MSSTDVGLEQPGFTEPLLSIQEIITSLSQLHGKLENAKPGLPQQITAGNNTAANNQTGNEQDGSKSGDVSRGNSDVTNKQEGGVSHGNSNKQEGGVSQENSNKQEGGASQENSNKQEGGVSQENSNKQEGGVSQENSNKQEGGVRQENSKQEGGVSQENRKKQDGDVSQKNQEGLAQKIKNTGSDKKEEVEHELEKLRKELQYMIRSFKKLENFETSLREPLKTLEANVKDILNDLPLVNVDELPKQVPLNLRVLRNNITRVKIQIPLQHQAANTISEANRALQTTVATREAEDLPHLYNEEIFKGSYYFKEITEKYNNDLDDREKLCLFCFAIFPENAEIKKRLLRFWWVGENLVPGPADDPKDEMERVSKTLQKFVEKGFIEPVQKKNKLQPRSYKMNPFVRSFLIKYAKMEHFFDYGPEGKPTMNFSICKKACMVKSEGAPASWFSDYLKEPGTERLPADLVKLQMLFNFPGKETLIQASQQFHELQTLFNISKQFPALPMEWFSKMTGIKVLYLGRWEASSGRQRHIEVEDTDFLKGLKNMKKLRLLSLQGISGITKLPSTLCKLENLRILDLRACHNLEKLPDKIGSLKKLTYLDLSECYLLDDMPKQMNQLWELQVLKGFVIGNDKSLCTLDDLSDLKNLRKLSVNVNTTEFNIDQAKNALEKFQNLQKLKIAWGAGGFKDPTQDGSKHFSGQSNPSGGESKKRENDVLKSKSKNKASNAAKSSTEKDKVNGESNAGDHKGDDKKLKSGEANSKTTNEEEDNKRQNFGATKSVSGQDSRKQGTGTGSQGIGPAANVLLFANKLRRGKKSKNPDPEGLGKLVKLDLQCFPRSAPPDWLVPQKMISLMNLSIRGGKLSHLKQKGNEKWKVKTLRLKFLMDFKMNWKEMLERFEELEYLEKVRCPRITFCPCDASGVWQKSSK